MKTVDHFIHGKIVAGTQRPVRRIFNPATGERSARVALADPGEVDAAVQAAAKAFPNWAATPPLTRARVLFRFRELLERHEAELSAIITSEHGKVLSDAKGEITRGMEVVEFACGIPQLLKGEYTEQIGRGVDNWSMRQPLGVVAGITPFNFPAMVPMWMFPVALACGNCFILKPSERDPSAGMRLAALLKEAGLPDGVFNVVHGDKAAVDALLHHPGIAAVSFVGSTAIAEYIYATGAAQRQAGAGVGRRQEPHGGDARRRSRPGGRRADGRGLRRRRRALHGSLGRRRGGRRRRQARRQADAEDPRAQIGPGTDPEAEMGPLVTRQHLDKVRSYVDQGVKEGAKLVVDGRDLKLQGYEDGFFLGGCLFDDVTTEMKIYREEIFGPVLLVVRAPDFDFATRIINEHEYGNGTAIFTRDGDAAREFASRIQIGMVGVNVPIPVPMAFHSFGGWKRSMFGDHFMYGPEGVRFFTRMKTVMSRWPTGIRAGADFIMPTMK